MEDSLSTGGINDVVEQPVEFLMRLTGGGAIRCKASYDICQRLFGWELEYSPKMVHNLNQGDYTIWVWVEKQPAHIPPGLEDYIGQIELERKIYLTD